MNNGTNVTWSTARQLCINDSMTITTNKTGYITHLLALESAIETTSLIYWMKGYLINKFLFNIIFLFSLGYSESILD
jgi:hypothetical protein